MTGAALVTGATSGVGLSVAKALRQEGWAVTGLGRRAPAMRCDGMAFARVDFAELATVRAFVESSAQRYDLLLMSAGVGTADASRVGSRLSSDGYELRFQVNYLAHYYLVTRLMDAGGSSDRFSCVGITTRTCSEPRLAAIEARRCYDPALAYAESKGALAMLCWDLFEGFYRHGQGRALPCNPGSYIPTGMDRPGRPRLTPLSVAVQRVARKVDKVVKGRATVGDFDGLPAEVARPEARHVLRDASDFLVRRVITESCT